jgi:dUTP pyrophosphatase
MANFEVGVYKVDPNVPSPVRATEQSACWDLHLALHGIIKFFDADNLRDELDADMLTTDDGGKFITIQPGCRYLLPTGIKFDIPYGTSLRLHPRSSLAWKHGLTLANAEGIIDSDYRLETMIVLQNTTSVPAKLYDHDRIAQLELVPVASDEMVALIDTDEEPAQLTDRTGGFGSTGA